MIKKNNQYLTKDYSKEKWDYLIILDACRYDVFKEVVEEKKLKGELLEFNSQVSQTPFWYRKFWSYKKTDVNLISANPQPFTIGGGWSAYKKFKTARWADLQSETEKEFLKRWEEADYEIWNPNILLDIFAKYKKSNERYLLHFIPPHLPYIGTKGKRLLKKLGTKPNPHRSVYDIVRDYGRKGNWQELRECYKESLITSLDTIYARIGLFKNGKIVITSDHAEIIGDHEFNSQSRYGHGRDAEPKSNRWDLIRTVPWFEVEL